jgi:hypothetical protein
VIFLSFFVLKVKKYYFQILKTPIDKKLVNYSGKKIAKKKILNTRDFFSDLTFRECPLEVTSCKINIFYI